MSVGLGLFKDMVGLVMFLEILFILCIRTGLGADNTTTTTAPVYNTTTTTVATGQNETCNQTALNCLNGGVCYEDSNRPFCKCPSGWTGTQCESGECVLQGGRGEKTDRVLA